MKIIKRVLPLIVMLLSAITASGQMNRPMMDDAMMLADIIKKDYRSIPLELDRKESLVNDLEKAIALLNVYANVPAGPNRDRTLEVSIALERVNRCRYLFNKLGTISLSAVSLSTGSTNNKDTNNSYLNETYTKLDSARKDLVNVQIVNNIEQLQQLVNNNDSIFRLLAATVLLKAELIGNSEFANQLDIFGGTQPQTSIAKAIPLLGAGGISFTTAIDALGTYLADRLKDELALEIATQMSSAFKSGKHPFVELEILLPSSVALLKAIQPIGIPNLLENLKQKVKTDLDNLLDNGPKLLTIAPYNRWVQDYPELAFAFEGITLIKQLSKVNHPMELVPLLENSFVFTRTWSNNDIMARVNRMKQVVQFMALLNNGLKVSQGGTGMAWINITNLQPYIKDPNFCLAWVALLVQSGKQIYPYNQIIEHLKYGVNRYLEPISNKLSVYPSDSLALSNLFNTNIRYKLTYLSSYLKPIHSVLFQAGALNDKVLEIQKTKKNNGEVGYEQVCDFTLATIDLLDTLLSAVSQIDKLNNKLASRESDILSVRRYLLMGRKGAGVYKNMKEKNYINAISTLIELLPEQPDKTPFLKLATDLSVVVMKYKPLIDLSGPGSHTDSEMKEVKELLSSFEHNDLDLLKKKLKSEKASNWTSLEESNLKTFLINHANELREAVKEPLRPLFEEIGNTLNNDTVLKFVTPEDRHELQTLMETIDTDLNNLFTAGVIPSPPLPTTVIQINKLKRIGTLTRLGLALLERKAGVKNEEVLRYINFFGSVASATSTDELKEAFKNVFEPVGSWSKKRYSTFDVSLNAYAGASVGYEFAKDKKWQFATGLSVPIGISLSRTIKRKPTKGIPGSMTLFVSVLDVGAITWLRFQDDTATLPELTWANLLAPGAHIIWGIPRTGLCLAAYCQYGPFVRKIGSKMGEIIYSKSNLRLGLGVYYDMPLIRLYSKKPKAF